MSLDLGAAVRSVTFESNLTPPIQLDDPLSPGSSTKGPGAVALLRPKLTVQLAGGGAPIVIAPYGEPGRWWLAIYALAVLGAGAGLYLLVRRTAR